MAAALVRARARDPVGAAFETSLGFGGYAYTFLDDHVPAYRGLRASARLGIFVLMFVGVLAAYGYRALAEGRASITRAALVTALAAGLLAEYHATFGLTAFANTASSASVTPAPLSSWVRSMTPRAMQCSIDCVDDLPPKGGSHGMCQKLRVSQKTVL